jgi:hypothetical protein
MNSFTEETFYRFPLVARHSQLLASVQHDDMAALKLRLNFANPPHIDDGGPVNAGELTRIELFSQRLESFPHIVDPASGVQA